MVTVVTFLEAGLKMSFSFTAYMISFMKKVQPKVAWEELTFVDEYFEVEKI